MLISTKGRYALRILIDLAEIEDRNIYTRLDNLAEAQGISEKYLESIVNILMKAQIIEGMRGRGGGYRLTQAPENFTVGQILRATENSLAPVSCIDCQNGPCPRTDFCKTLPMWKHLNSLIENYLDKVTLLDLANGKVIK